MSTKNPYKSINIDRSKMQEAVESLGAIGYSYQKAGNTYHLSCSIGGESVRLCVYENTDGSTTLSQGGTPNKDLIAKLCEQIKNHCKAGGDGAFNLALPKVPAEHAKHLLAFLAGEAKETIQAEEHGYLLTRLKGPQGDVLTVKVHNTTGTIQLQGRRAMLAALAQDFLTTVLPYEKAVQAQIDTFSVPISVSQVRNELEGRLPSSFGKLESIVCAQLTSALALTKVDIQLPDYGAVAFPALRGLEGFIKVELFRAGFTPSSANSLGEYFKQGTVVGTYVMHNDVAAKAGEPLASRLVDCYTFYKKQRHGVAHMEADPAASRIVASLAEAKSIVEQVFDTIERFYR